MIIIGSTALKYHYPDFTREPKDLDLIVEDSTQHVNKPGIEFLENPVLLRYQKDGFIDPGLLLTLKISHMFWDMNWEKHLYDIQFLKSKFLMVDNKILSEFIEYWEETKPKVRRSQLALSKEDFFTNNVNENVDEHDHLHTLINPVPMFSRLLKDGAEVELDEDKWDFLSKKDKLEVVREETYVMAYERYEGKLHRIPAFRRQLKDNIMKHFPRYIAVFAILNYPELENPMFNYYKRIQDGLKRN